ncbi:right-handed parallel beta-helix repeat-containing protein [Croceimicrobium sp.]|uniref:right-handed parallel beta-helix repeat-containing protein n=1 Tax=Croceimicrobium sp. TaxID=2828340 RepID=UPI003BA8D8EF
MKRTLILFGLVIHLFAYGQRSAPFLESFSIDPANPSQTVPPGWSGYTNSPYNALWTFSNWGNVDGIPNDQSGDNGRVLFSRGNSLTAVGQVSELQTEYLDLTILTTPELSFSLLSYNQTYAALAPNANKFSVDFFDGQTWHDSIFVLQDQSQQTWIIHTVSLSPYLSGSAQLDSCKLRFRLEASFNPGTTNNTNPYHNVAIDNIRVDNSGACSGPLQITVGTVGDTSATISWSGTGASSYELQYWDRNAVNFGLGNQSAIKDTILSATSFTLNDLKSLYHYAARLRAICSSSGSSNWSAVATFNTLCGSIKAPYYYGCEPVDAHRVDSLPSCWGYYSTLPNSVAYIDDYAPNSYSLPLCFVAGGNRNTNDPLLNTYNDTLSLVLPHTPDLTSGTKQISFYIKFPWNAREPVKVGTLQSSDPKSTFSLLKTIYPKANSSYYKVTVPFNSHAGYNGIDEYISFRMEGVAIQGQFNLDDINYHEIPACTPVTDVRFIARTDSSATFVVDVADTNTQIEYSWVARGAAFSVNSPTLGGVVLSGTSGTVLANSWNGLVSGGAYDLYVKSFCDSVYYGPVPFSLACQAFTAPYFTDFEGGSQLADHCWRPYTNLSQASSISLNVDSINALSGIHHINFDNDGFSLIKDSLVILSPSFSDMPNGDKQIRFQILSDDNATAKLYGAPFTDPKLAGLIVGTTHSDRVGGAVSILDTLYPDSTGVYEEVIVQLDSLHGYNGNDDQIFLMHGQDDSRESIFIDDFYYETNNCGTPHGMAVSSLSDTSAVLRWTEGLYVNSYELWVGPKGFYQGTSTSGGHKTLVNIDSLVLDTLNALECYEFLIRSNCTVDTNHWIGPISFCQPCLNPLAGTYSVGSSASADFSSFSQVANRLKNCGISAPVVFNIEAGTYNDTLHLDFIPGLSSQNTLSFQGNNSTLSHPSGAATARTIWLDGVSNISFKGLTIQNLATTYGSAEVIRLSSSHQIVIDSCQIEMDSVRSGFSYSAIHGLSSSNLTISNSHIFGGDNSIYCEGGNIANPDSNIRVEGNTLKGFAFTGLWFEYVDSLEVHRNTFKEVSSMPLGAVGIYVFKSRTPFISGNKVEGSWSALMLDGLNTVDTVGRALLVNNFFYSSGGDGVALYDSHYTTMYHNSILGATGINSIGNGHIDLRNNIFSATSSFAASLDAVNTNDVLDYNIYHSQSSSGQVVKYAGLSHSSLSAWQGVAPSLNAHSLFGLPGFRSNFDLHITGQLPNNIGDTTLGVFEDIDSDPRLVLTPLFTDIGADEYTPILNDISVDQILGLDSLRCGDTSTHVFAVISNVGLSNQSGFNVKLDVTGPNILNRSIPYQGVLNSGFSDTISLGMINTFTGGAYRIAAISDLVGDQNKDNDTLVLSRYFLSKAKPEPSLSKDTVCPGESVILILPKDGGRYRWETSNGQFLGREDSINIGPIGTSDTSFVLRSEGYKTLDTLGLVSASLNAAHAIQKGGLRFEVFGSINLDSVQVFAGNTGGLVLNILELATGTVLFADTIAIANPLSVYQPVWLQVNKRLTAGDYIISAAKASGNLLLSYENQSPGFPFEDQYAGINLLESVIESSNGSWTNTQSEYRYFYNWKTSLSNDCNRPDTMVVIHVDTSFTIADFQYQVLSTTLNQADVSFNASSSKSANTYTWDFGDGTSGSGELVNHSYLANGLYSVKLIAEGNCDLNSIIKQVAIQGINIEEFNFNEEIEIWPNPATTELNIALAEESAKQLSIEISDFSGRVIESPLSSNREEGQMIYRLDVSHCKPGVYLLRIKSHSGNYNGFQKVLITD